MKKLSEHEMNLLTRILDHLNMLNDAEALKRRDEFRIRYKKLLDRGIKRKEKVAA